MTPQTYRALPLDQRRDGFVLSEQAAAIVLRAVDDFQPGQIELLATATADEAHHVVLPAPGMPALQWLAAQLLRDRRIDLLHPHATGTRENDAAELAALLPHIAPDCDVYACKGALGHGLGAAGLTALVIACLCARTGQRPPMPWLRQPIACGHALERQPRQCGPLRSHAVFAAGFGGHVAAAVIQRSDA
jgi:3-oxoacyl-(acyl-carrier-protein) synthase